MTKGNQNISCSNLWKEVQWVNDADRSGADQEARASVKPSSVHSFSFLVFSALLQSLRYFQVEDKIIMR